MKKLNTRMPYTVVGEILAVQTLAVFLIFLEIVDDSYIQSIKNRGISDEGRFQPKMFVELYRRTKSDPFFGIAFFPDTFIYFPFFQNNFASL